MIFMKIDTPYTVYGLEKYSTIEIDTSRPKRVYVLQRFGSLFSLAKLVTSIGALVIYSARL